MSFGNISLVPLGFLKFINELKATGGMPNIHLVFNGVVIKKAPGLDYWNSYGYNGYRYGNKNPYTKADDDTKKKVKSKTSYLNRIMNHKSN